MDSDHLGKDKFVKDRTRREGAYFMEGRYWGLDDGVKPWQYMNSSNYCTIRGLKVLLQRQRVGSNEDFVTIMTGNVKKNQFVGMTNDVFY